MRLQFDRAIVHSTWRASNARIYVCVGAATLLPKQIGQRDWLCTVHLMTLDKQSNEHRVEVQS